MENEGNVKTRCAFKAMELIQFTETVKTKEEVGWREKNNNSGIYKV